jgi:excisionase family DNA binding protein
MRQLSDDSSNVIHHTSIDRLNPIAARPRREVAHHAAMVLERGRRMTTDHAGIRAAPEYARETGSAPSPARLLEAEDVAALLGMTTDWVYREVRAGRLPHIRLGRYVRFRSESIDAWLLACERGMVAPGTNRPGDASASRGRHRRTNSDARKTA